MPKLQFRANPKQRQALRLWMDKTTTEIGYGGAAGGGKSFVIVAATWMSCMAYPGTRWFWGRKELKNLKRTTLASYFKFCDVYGVGAEQRGNFNAQEGYIRFPNGSEILLLDMARNPSDPLYTRFGSLELTGG